MTPPDVSDAAVEADFRACYSDECMNCGQSPTVLVFVGDKLEYDTELCGACCFGEAACIDPENW